MPVCPRGALALTEGELEVAWDRCELAGACVEICLPGALEMVGRHYSVEEVLEILEEDRIFYDESLGGVTFSGGEPFAQPGFLAELLDGCRERDLPVVLDTCGHVDPVVFREVGCRASALLFDLKMMDEARHQEFTGVHNRWILQNLRWAAGGGGAERRPALTVRIPLIPGINDDEANLRGSAHFLAGLVSPPPVDILPYHRLGVDKYERLGREYHLPDATPPPGEGVECAARLFEERGLVVTIRGEPHGHDREST